MPRYSSLRNKEAVVYIDESDRKEFLGSPRLGVCDWAVIIVVHLVWFISLPITWWCSFKVIPQYERAVVYRVGRLMPLQGPGLIYVIPLVDQWTKVDMRMKELKVPPQEILTLDKVILKVGADVQYRITDPLASHSLVQDLNQSLRNSAHASLNSMISCEKQNYVLNEKQFVSLRLQEHMNKLVSQWGIEIARFELTHSCLMRSVESQQQEDEVDGMAMIADVLKSLVSPSSSSFSMPGMMPGMMPSTQATGETTPSNVQLLDAEQMFHLIKGIIDEDVVQRTQAIFEIRINDPGSPSKTWTLNLKDGAGFVKLGDSTHTCDARLTASNETFVKMFYNQLTPKEAYMSGQLKIDGSTLTAMKLEYLITKLLSLKV